MTTNNNLFLLAFDDCHHFDLLKSIEANGRPEDYNRLIIFSTATKEKVLKSISSFFKNFSVNIISLDEIKNININKIIPRVIYQDYYFEQLKVDIATKWDTVTKLNDSPLFETFLPLVFEESFNSQVFFKNIIKKHSIIEGPATYQPSFEKMLEKTKLYQNNQSSRELFEKVTKRIIKDSSSLSLDYISSSHIALIATVNKSYEDNFYYYLNEICELLRKSDVYFTCYFLESEAFPLNETFATALNNKLTCDFKIINYSQASLIASSLDVILSVDPEISKMFSSMPIPQILISSKWVPHPNLFLVKEDLENRPTNTKSRPYPVEMCYDLCLYLIGRCHIETVRVNADFSLYKNFQFDNYYFPLIIAGKMFTFKEIRRCFAITFLVQKNGDAQQSFSIKNLLISFSNEEINASLNLEKKEFIDLSTLLAENLKFLLHFKKSETQIDKKFFQNLDVIVSHATHDSLCGLCASYTKDFLSKRRFKHFEDSIELIEESLTTLKDLVVESLSLIDRIDRSINAQENFNTNKKEGMQNYGPDTTNKIDSPAQ